jgi:lysophospholipase
MEAAPFHADVSTHPEGAEAFWLRTRDGVRIRIAVWRAGTRGTVLMFPGRTEYIEKYTHVAAEMGARGYATVIVDWRGQGLADRPLADRAMGHVHRFRDYQHDVAAVTDAVQTLGLPGPMFLMAHSMGGCIGLRSLIGGLAVRAVAFTGPMWGIKITPALRPVAWVMGFGARALGMDHRYAPTTGPETYVLAAPFADNTLTRDPDMYAMMQRQMAAHPELALGGPSMTWLLEGLIETRALFSMRSPAVPCLTAMGAVERIVDQPRIRERMTRWPGGRLDEYADAEHEIIMETPAHRARLFTDAAELFDAHRA